MTMTPHPDDPSRSEMTQDTTQLSRATSMLRERRHPRAVEVANDVLRKAVRSSRHSLPIRAQGSYDFVHVSDQVLIGRLRQAIDAASPTCAVGKVYLGVEPDAQLREITVELFVQYDEPLIAAADHVRTVVVTVLDETLGAGSVSIGVTPTHVHVSDITIDNPHLVDPSDEHPR